MFSDPVAETIITKTIRSHRKIKNKLKKIDKKDEEWRNIDPYFIVVTLVMTWQIRIDDMADDMENRLVSRQTNI